MAGVKLIVMYPQPKDVAAFEKVYQAEHVPMAVSKLEGKTRLVATKVIASPQGTPLYYRIAEVYFPSMEALQACAAWHKTPQVIVRKATEPGLAERLSN